MFPSNSPFQMPLANFDPSLIPKNPPPRPTPGQPREKTSFVNEVDRVRFLVHEAQTTMARGDIPATKVLLEQIEDALLALI